MEAVPYLLYRSPKSSCTLTNGVSPYPVPAVIQERRIVRIGAPTAESAHSAAWKYAV